jgi:DHA1 family bicyclomycin/chloramphenicol resistance-like MFS transporter
MTGRLIDRLGDRRLMITG